MMALGSGKVWVCRIMLNVFAALNDRTAQPRWSAGVARSAMTSTPIATPHPVPPLPAKVVRERPTDDPLEHIVARNWMEFLTQVRVFFACESISRTFELCPIIRAQIVLGISYYE